MSVAAEVHSSAMLPDRPDRLWARGELHDALGLPHDGTRVEVVEGEIVVSPAPLVSHNKIALGIARVIWAAVSDNPELSWDCAHGDGLLLPGRGDGCIPDLIVLDAEVHEAADDEQVRYFTADQIEMAVEVTSPSNAANDRKPLFLQKFSKWRAYAHAGIPFYLLVDRDPQIARTTLYSLPDPPNRAYLEEESWEFGEAVKLPEPFGIEIPTDRWRPWKD